ncbi:MAG: hypothetical protein WBF84_06705 [Castellaniella sp.]|uniref:hypothetical protein n=1 Tax=Castellaniella sp. TaxID=1955812 RepID=UPI003C731D49
MADFVVVRMPGTVNRKRLHLKTFDEWVATAAPSQLQQAARVFGNARRAYDLVTAAFESAGGRS